MNTRQNLIRLALVILLASTALNAAEPAANLVLKPNDKIAFLGDSITNYGWRHPTGYVRLVEKALVLNGVPIEVVPAGVSGHRSNDMLKRLQTDVLDHAPKWMLLSCGVNDVFKGKDGVPLEEYKKNMTAIVDQAQAAGIKVILLTATMVYEDPDNEQNRQLAEYNGFLQDLAEKKGCLLVDVNSDMVQRVKAYRATLNGVEPRDIFTKDGIHPNGHGDILMATAVLRGIGFTDEMIAAVKPEWLEMDTRIGHLGAMTGRGHANPNVWERDERKAGPLFPMKFKHQLWIESLDESKRQELQEQVDALSVPLMVKTIERMQAEGEAPNGFPNSGDSK